MKWVIFYAIAQVQDYISLSYRELTGDYCPYISRKYRPPPSLTYEDLRMNDLSLFKRHLKFIEQVSL